MPGSEIPIPAQPSYIFRGHSAQIHSLTFWRRNSRLVAGDADGWIVLWNVATRRPTAVWKAHKASILTVELWGDERLISYDFAPFLGSRLSAIIL
jgi:ASTRA-associated protein 1